MLQSLGATVLFVAGRVILASLFLFAGYLKINNYQGTLGTMAEAGLEPAWLLLPPTIALELGGGFLVAIGRWGAVPAALALTAFTIATNIFFHDFWTMEGEMARLEGSLFIKNVAIAGGLLFVAGALAREQAQKR